MSDQNNNLLKPFCPVHHWRMAWDNGSAKSTASFRCNFDKCNIHYSASQGYFELGKTSGDPDLVARAQIVACQRHGEHHPAIVGYIKEALGQRSDEWRQWQCLAQRCEFSTRQKLLAEKSEIPKSSRIHAANREHAFSNR
jgi:hypothetical protein